MSNSHTSKDKSTPKTVSCPEHSLSVDPSLNANLKIYKRLLERSAELDKELLKFSGINDKESDLKTVMDQLHRYNDIKDATQIILGSLATLEGSTVGELHERYGLTSNDS